MGVGAFATGRTKPSHPATQALDAVLASGERIDIKVLLVEDDPVDLSIIVRNFGRSRFMNSEITSARTLERAEAAMRGRRFDLVVLDFWVQGASSLPLLDKIRRGHKDVVPIMLSSIDFTDVQGLGMTFGALGFLSKSDLSGSALDAVVRTGLAQRAAQLDALARRST